MKDEQIITKKIRIIIIREGCRCRRHAVPFKYNGTLYILYTMYSVSIGEYIIENQKIDFYHIQILNRAV